MPLRSEMTVWGLYNYDYKIFLGLNIPDNIDRDIFIHALLVDCMDLEILYPDPEFMRDAIRSWSWSMKHSWLQIRDALYANYNVIENYNKNESWTDDATRTDDLKEVNNGGTTGSGTIGGTNSSTNTHSSKGYNSSAWVAGEKDEVSGSVNNTTSDSTTTNNTRTNTGTLKNKVTRTGNVHGNIGVTTNQQMIQAEIDLRIANQLTYIIIDDFKRRFCLLVY